MVKNGEIINNEWQVVTELGSGGQGTVFEAININGNTPVAVKVVSRSIDTQAFQREVNAYLHITQRCNNDNQLMIPRLYGFGSCGSDADVMVMELMGPDLHTVWEANYNYFSTDMVILFFKQVLVCLEKLHQTGMVHRDIKPENICFGKGVDETDIRLLDLGYCSTFTCLETGTHVPMKYGESTGGTVLYSSLNQHGGGSPSRKDDLEGLCYTMMDLHNVSLPWTSSISANMPLAKQHETVAQWKKLDAETICQGYPRFFQNLLKYVKLLEHDEVPNYDKMHHTLDEALMSFEDKK